jgi:hypothetical protein
MENKDQIEALRDIRSLMERSSRFISLSGLSGVFAGIYALVGAYFAYQYMKGIPDMEISTSGEYDISSLVYRVRHSSIYEFFFVNAGLVLAFSLTTGFLLTRRKAKKSGQKMWDSLAQRLMINLCIPLFTGGIFCLLLLYHGVIGLIAPCMLIFYGLSLVNASKYTLNDIRYLGISEILLGLISTYYVGYGLFFWAVGFGLLHILYGSLMYFKYERG